ncbi:MAG: hypothetical protein FWD68_09370 [Alphaproteobacteria bacterium]|nr:hypothetical protein [Alphaproteobacteria bacterium]
MSYDLFLNFAPAVKKNVLVEFFHKRQNYTLNEGGIVYSNDDTGVYFMLHFKENRSLFSSVTIPCLHICINYLRPSFFALEAEIEIAAITAHFPCRIDDPQAEAESGGETFEGFLRAWNARNRQAVAAMQADGKAPVQVATLPRRELEESWRWNYARREGAGHPLRDQFLPRIIYARVGGRVGTAVIWGNAVAARLPRVDFVFVGRTETGTGTARPVVGVVPWEEFASVLENAGFAQGEDGFELNYASAPEGIVEFVRTVEAADMTTVVPLAADRIVDADV